MEHGVVSPPGKRWTKEEIRALFEEGKTVAQIKKMTGLPGKVIGGMKGYYKSPMYDGPPVRIKENGEAKSQEVVQQTRAPPTPLTPPASNGGDKVTPPAGLDVPGVELEAGPAETQALAILQGKPYLIQVKNVYVPPGVLDCYQVSLAKGYKGSVGEFMGDCVLKLFKYRYNLVPAMISPPTEQSQ